jgi:hypothetical protein
MVETQKDKDEQISRFFEGIMSLVPRSTQYPLWFVYADTLANNEDGYARALDTSFRSAAKDRYNELRKAVCDVRAALHEGIGPFTEKCLRDLTERYLEATDKAVGHHQRLLKSYQDKLDKDEHRGTHQLYRTALKSNPHWLERIPRGEGEGWKYTYSDIAKTFPPNAPIPDRSWDHRIRTAELAKSVADSSDE